MAASGRMVGRPWDFPVANLAERGAAALGMPAGDLPEMAAPFFATPRRILALIRNGLIAAIPASVVATTLRMVF